MTTQDDARSPVNYRDTLFLPKTDFAMRAGLPQQEPGRIARWDADRIYQRLRERSRGRPAFMLHDGPPYANGNIHIGTAMNKILKDIVVRSHQMMGADAAYVPGWDCHGLPIEWKVEEAFRAAGREKRDVDASEFRRACRDYATRWVDIQRDEFKRLGIIGDWENPYLTMAYESEAATVREFLKVARSGQLKRGAKPVMWSPVEQTALAEAEIEYQDRKATTIWVKFPVVRSEGAALDGAAIVIWTTTPWTIPANRAISYSKSIKYGLYEVVAVPSEADLGFKPWAAPGETLVVADRCAEAVRSAARITEWVRRRDASPEGSICAHPLRNAGLGGYEFDVPLIPGEHVTDDAGTGFVHTAPGHGDDDYSVWMANRPALIDLGLDVDIPDTVDAFGRYTDICPGFVGLEIIRLEGKKRGEDGPANRAVIDALIKSGNLVARGQTTLRDAHSWRSKAPVIRRATAQWFIAMDRPLDDGRTLRERALAAIDETRFTPERGRQRIRSMVVERPDWLVSRQRAWGTPITLFLDRQSGAILEDDAVDARIIAAIEAEGADAWFTTPSAEFLGPLYAPDQYEKVTDILDVWFDSGTTHAFTLEDRGLKWPADLYLEGSDQHRGWFQSSLLESCATRGRAPFDGILTHGFVLAQDGRKMSKSLGNTVSPQEVCEQYGADILRLWVASSDYWDDPTFGPDIISSNVESYRKIRNTFRYLLGALEGFSDAEAVALADMPGLEQWLLHRLSEVDERVRRSYSNYDFKAVFQALNTFCVIDLSAVYFDIRKDSLYCDPLSAVRRRACRTVMNEVFECLTGWFAPILCFTTEEAREARGVADETIHLGDFHVVPANWRNPAIGSLWERIFEVRRAVTAALEVERREKRIGSSLEAKVRVVVNDRAYLDVFLDEDPAEIFISSQASIVVDADAQEPFGVKVDPADGVKCARSWKFFDPQTADPTYPDITARDAEAVREWTAVNSQKGE